MEQWIRDLIAAATGGIRDLAREVGERIAAVYSLIVRVLTSVKLATGKLFTSVSDARNWIEWAIGEGFLTAKYILVTFVPRLVSNAITAIQRWATDLITRLVNGVKATVSTLNQWIRDRVAELRDSLSTLRTWAIGKINTIIDTLVRVRDIVYLLLTDPRRLAQWLVAAMIAEIWRYVDSHADRIAAYLKTRSVSLTLYAAERIESIIARIL